jgi:hypothetical protein
MKDPISKNQINKKTQQQQQKKVLKWDNLQLILGFNVSIKSTRNMYKLKL